MPPTIETKNSMTQYNPINLEKEIRPPFGLVGLVRKALNLAHAKLRWRADLAGVIFETLTDVDRRKLEDLTGEDVKKIENLRAQRSKLEEKMVFLYEKIALSKLEFQRSDSSMSRNLAYFKLQSVLPRPRAVGSEILSAQRGVYYSQWYDAFYQRQAINLEIQSLTKLPQNKFVADKRIQGVP